MRGVKPEPAYLEPAWSGRWRFALAVFSLFAWMLSHKWWFFDLATEIDDCDPCASLGEMQFVLAYILVVTSLPSAFLAWKAWRTFRAAQYPPPGTWIIFRARIRTGWWAKLEAILLLAMAALFATAPVVVWRELDAFFIFFKHGC